MKKVYVLAATLLAVVSANANYLYWQVNEDSNVAGLDGVNYNSARVSIKNGSGNIVWYSDVTAVNAESLDYPISALKTIDVSTFTGSGYDYRDSAYSYYIELGTYAGSTFTGTAISQGETYSALAASYVHPTATLSPSDLVSAQIWHGGTYSVPEPTSAMLMLFGAAFLGLKRKNRRMA